MTDENTSHTDIADRLGKMVFQSCTCDSLRGVGEHDDTCPTDVLRTAAERIRAMGDVADHMMEQGTRMAELEINSAKLVAKAKVLVELTDDAERNHGGLISVALLRAKNELRLELSKWH